MDYTIDDLKYWDERIQEVALGFGLDFYPQEFEICDHFQMLSYLSYSGMPSHYPHWSYGKAYEKQKTLYDYGVMGLPYEMVINSNPCLAYLMRDNSLLLQILTMAHVYAHNDFFKNNFNFRHSRPEYTIEEFKNHAERIRGYVEDPSIGLERVEEVLDAAHSLSMQCNRNLEIKKLTLEEEKRRIWEKAQLKKDPFQKIHKRQEYKEPDLEKIPLTPEEDILLFIRDYNPYLSDWEKDILTIVHEEALYFIPQIDTKILNEGWASYWHKRILEKLNLPQEMGIEFAVRHSQILRPYNLEINPYYVGYKILEDIKKRWDNPSEEEKKEFNRVGNEGDKKLFLVREVDRDVSFLRQYLTEDLIRELNLFKHEKFGEDRKVTKVADKEGWRDIKEIFIKNAGCNIFPVIKIEDADYQKNRSLFLKHYHDGRDLEIEYAEKTLAYIYKLWQRPVILETIIEEKKYHLSYNGEKVEKKVV
jgi:stage V sporulation protein R